MSIFHKTLKDNVNDGQQVYVPANSKYWKVEPVYGRDPYSDRENVLIGFVFFLDTSCPFKKKPSSAYPILVRKKKEENHLVTFYEVRVHSLNKFLNMFGKFIHARNADDYMSESEFLTSMDDVRSSNSLKDETERTHYTIAHIERPSNLDEESQKLFKQFLNPTEEDLLQLTDFSSKFKDLYSQPTKLEGQAAYDKIEEIFNEYYVEEELRTPLLDAIKVDAFLNPHRNLEDFKQNSGVVLYGPFGTGKSFIVEEALYRIWKEVLGFGYTDVNVPEVLGGRDSQFWGAAMRAVNRVFMPVFRKIQKDNRPYLLFIDEGDTFVKDSGKNQDAEEGEAGIKNILNPKSRPGLIVVINTNMEKGFNMGVVERRLELLKVDYPNKTRAEIVWKIYEKHIFGNQSSLNDSEYDRIIEIIAGNIGIEAVEKFCKKYIKVYNNNEPYQNFSHLVSKFRDDVIDGINRKAQEKIDKLSRDGRREMFNDEIEEVKRQTEEQIERIQSAVAGNSAPRDTSYRRKMAKNDDDNPFYLAFKTFTNDYTAFYNLVERIEHTRDYQFENSDKELIKQIYESLYFINEHLHACLPIYRNKLIQFEGLLRRLQDYIENIILSNNAFLSLREEYQHLHGIKPKPLSKKEKDQIFVILLSSNFPDELYHEDNSDPDQSGNGSMGASEYTKNRFWLPGDK